MRLTYLKRGMLSSLVTLVFLSIATPARAIQEADARPGDTRDDDDGFDPGLLGLVGLAGLLGLKRRDPRDARPTGNRV